MGSKIQSNERFWTKRIRKEEEFYVRTLRAQPQGVVVGTGTLGIPTARMNFAYDDPGVQDHISNIREMRTAGLIPGPADDVKPDDSVSVRSVATGVRSLDVGSVAESAAMRKLAELEEQLKSERERAMNLQSELDRMKVASTSGGSQAPGAELRGARGDGAPSRVGQPRASGAASTAASRPGASRPGQTGAAGSERGFRERSRGGSRGPGP